MTTITCMRCGAKFEGRAVEAIAWDVEHVAKWCANKAEATK